MQPTAHSAGTVSSTTHSKQTLDHRESYESLQRRQQAQRILNSYEQLMWHAVARHESVPQTRRYFQAVASGFLKPGDNSLSVMIDHTPLSDAYTCVSPWKSKDAEASSSREQQSSRAKRKATKEP